MKGLIYVDVKEVVYCFCYSGIYIVLAYSPSAEVEDGTFYKHERLGLVQG